MKTQTATITTVKIEYTEAALIRCVARQDIPEAGIKEGQVIYLIRSSKNDGTYYIATWNYERMQWDCRCPATKPCRHMKLMSQDCKQPHTLQGYKPPTKGEKFAVLMVQHDVRFQAERLAAVAEQAAEAKMDAFKRGMDEQYASDPRHGLSQGEVEAARSNMVHLYDEY